MAYIALAIVATGTSVLFPSGFDVFLLLISITFSLVCVVIALRPKVVVSDDEVEIVNIWDHHRLPREDVREFVSKRWGSGRCVTYAGPTYPVAVLQSSDATDWLYPNVSDKRARIRAVNEALRPEGSSDT
jgi:hypothetical protein